MTLLMRDQENIEKGREEGLKEGLKKGLKEGLKEGLREGQKKGESLFAELTRQLLKDKRYNDLKKGTIDTEYRKKLYEEYHIL